MINYKSLSVILAGILLFLIILFAPRINAKINDWDYRIQKADDATNYQILKKVEDTCRAMISSYEADRLTWEQYKASDDKEKQSWGEQAKMRANKTAASYNNYYLENSFVWSDAVPSDIKQELPYLQ